MSFMGKIARLFGLIRVKTVGNQVKVTGVDALIMRKYIRKIFETDIISKMMFTHIGETSFSFHQFFIPDIIYVLTKVRMDPKTKWSVRNSIDKIIQGFMTETWYKSTIGDIKPMIDPKRMNVLKWKPLPRQEEFLHLYGDRMPRYDLRGYILALGPGGGKMAPLYSLIKTPSGWTKMGDIKPNDLVLTPYGTTSRVIGVYPQGVRPIYRITLDDDSSTECGAEHLWRVYDARGDWKIKALCSFWDAFSKDTLIPKVSDNFEMSLHQIKSVEYVGDVESQCIEIDNTEGLYITDGNIVTHNTFTDLLVASCVIPPSVAEVKIIISPKKALHLVWEDSIQKLFKKPPTYWCSDSGTEAPLKNTEYYVFNFESIPKAIELAKKLSAKNTRYFIIVDESHNFADPKSNRTQSLVNLHTVRDDTYFIWTSGTPILKLGTELIAFLKCADPRFDAEAERRFKKIFSSSKGRANEIFNHRLGQMMAFLVPKSQLSDSKPTIKELPIRLPPALAHKFLMKTVREDMRVFIEDRIKFYQKDMINLKQTVNRWLEYHKSNLSTKEEEKQFSIYLKNLKIITKNPDLMLPEILEQTRRYERMYLLPSLPPVERKAFRSALSAIKNIKLKVRGEALGKVLSRRRSEATAALALYCKPEEIIKDSLSKTLFFASSVYPVETLARHLEKKGFQPARVFGDTNKDLTKIINQFHEDPNLNPICATMQSLSEAVPVTAASTVVLLNRPFREATYSQVVSRADRMGQKYPVTVIETTLDTGTEPNVSSRTDEILFEVRSLINELVGEDFAGPKIDEREYLDTIDYSQVDPIIQHADSLMGL